MRLLLLVPLAACSTSAPSDGGAVDYGMPEIPTPADLSVHGDISPPVDLPIMDAAVPAADLAMPDLATPDLLGEPYGGPCKVDTDCAPVVNGTPTCASGTCQIASCDTDYRVCPPTTACSTNIATDPANCGACGVVCPSVKNGAGGCANFQCGVGKCDTGFADCNGVGSDGCEVDLLTDVNNCGACGTMCSKELPQNHMWTCNNGDCAGSG